MRSAGAGAGGKAPKTTEQLRAGVKDAAKRPENKRCADCTERFPQYVNLNFNTFVCTPCSGIHREFNHRIKGILASNFTEEEVRAIRKGGNQACNDLYLGKYDPNIDIPEPDGQDGRRRREFIRAKYLDRRWYGTAEDIVREIEERTRRQEEREAARASARGHHRKHSSSSRKSSFDSAGGSSAGGLSRGSVGGGGIAANIQNTTTVDLMDLLSAPAAPATTFASPAPLPPAGGTGAAAGGMTGGWGAFQAPPPAATPSSATMTTTASTFSGPGILPPPPSSAGSRGLLQPPPQGTAVPIVAPQAPVAASTPFGSGVGGDDFGAFQSPPQPQQQFNAPFVSQPGSLQSGFPPSGSSVAAFPPHTHGHGHALPQQQMFASGPAAMPMMQQPQQLGHARMGSGGTTEFAMHGGEPVPILQQAASDPFSNIEPEQVPHFEEKEKCLYQKGGETHPAVIVKKHRDGANPPFYSVLILHSGQEKNTDHHHLIKLGPTAAHQQQNAHLNGGAAVTMQVQHPPHGVPISMPMQQQQQQQQAFAPEPSQNGGQFAFANPFGGSGAPADRPAAPEKPETPIAGLQVQTQPQIHAMPHADPGNPFGNFVEATTLAPQTSMPSSNPFDLF